jgi:hypothetical protein
MSSYKIVRMYQRDSRKTPRSGSTNDYRSLANRGACMRSGAVAPQDHQRSVEAQNRHRSKSFRHR